MAALAESRKLPDIVDISNQSSKEGIRIEIELKKGADAERILAGLYKKTKLEDTFGVNMLAVKDKQPITFTLKHMLQEFVLFQEELYTKEYEHLLAKAKDRLEIVNGLIKATDVIDLIIEILRGSQSVKQAKSCLIDGITEGITFRSKKSEKDAATLSFTERQADAILAMPLSRLIGLELLKLHQEKDVLDDNIAQYLVILNNKEELDKTIIARLKQKTIWSTQKNRTCECLSGQIC